MVFDTILTHILNNINSFFKENVKKSVTQTGNSIEYLAGNKKREGMCNIAGNS